MRLADYQRIHALYMGEGDDKVEQVANVVCDLYGFTHEQVNDMEPLLFLRYAAKVERMAKRALVRPWWLPRLIGVNAKRMTLGQWVEVQYWLQQGDIEAIHLIAASMFKVRWIGHQRLASWLLRRPVRWVRYDVQRFLVSMRAMVDEYRNLFESDDSDEEEGEEEKQHPFITQYGWLFAVGEVARYEGVTRDKAYNLPVVQALNALAYLKAEQKYKKHLTKK